MKTSSSTATWGTTYRSSPQSTVSAWMIASVSGMVRRQTRALAERRVDVDRAADPLDVGLHHVHADAAAGHVGDLASAVEKPGWKTSAMMSRGVHRRRPARRGARPLLDGLLRDPLDVDAGAVVGDLDRDVAALVVRPQRERALRVLARGDPRAPASSMPWSTALRTRWVSGSLTASSRLRSSSVSLPCMTSWTCLPQRVRQVADHPRQLRPDVVDRLHAGLHDALLQLAGDQVEPLGGADQRRVAGLRHAADELVAGQHQLADQVHQAVEQVDVDPDGAVGDAALGRSAPATPR